MTTSNYKNPPVLEAVFNISTAPEYETINRLRNTSSIFEKDFPNKKELNRIEGRLNLSAEVVSSDNTKTLIGFSYSQDNAESQVQRRVDGFSFHKLKQYCGWPQFIQEAMRYWNMNSNDSNKDKTINRLGLRFINLIKIHNHSLDQSFSISISKTKQIGNLTKVAYSYFLDLEEGYKAAVNLYPSSNDEYTLDIDIFKSFNPCTMNEEEIREAFCFMRKQKNIIFTKTLKSAILKQYKPIKEINDS